MTTGLAITATRRVAAERAVGRLVTLRGLRGLPLTAYEWSTIADRVIAAAARFGYDPGNPRSSVYLALRADAKLNRLPLAAAYLTDANLATIADAVIYAIASTE